MLTEKEKEEIANLSKTFHKVVESKDYNYMASRRLDISRVWAKKLFVATIALNILSIIFFSLTIISFAKRPVPEFYATAPSGKIYPIKNLHLR